jgi:hypothetical protein
MPKTILVELRCTRCAAAGPSLGGAFARNDRGVPPVRFYFFPSSDYDPEGPMSLEDALGDERFWIETPNPELTGPETSPGRSELEWRPEFERAFASHASMLPPARDL